MLVRGVAAALRLFHPAEQLPGLALGAEVGEAAIAFGERPSVTLEHGNGPWPRRSPPRSSAARAYTAATNKASHVIATPHIAWMGTPLFRTAAPSSADSCIR